MTATASLGINAVEDIEFTSVAGEVRPRTRLQEAFVAGNVRLSPSKLITHSECKTGAVGQPMR